MEDSKFWIIQLPLSKTVSLTTVPNLFYSAFSMDMEAPQSAIILWKIYLGYYSHNFRSLRKKWKRQKTMLKLFSNKASNTYVFLLWRQIKESRSTIYRTEPQPQLPWFCLNSRKEFCISLMSVIQVPIFLTTTELKS